jgi:hypothetical protein
MQAITDKQLARRIALEKRIVRKLVKALLADGYEVAVDNGGEDLEVDYTKNFTTIVKGLFACDEERLYARKDGKGAGVLLVYGNDGWDVICDYNCRLESIIGPIIDWAGNLDR